MEVEGRYRNVRKDEVYNVIGSDPIRLLILVNDSKTGKIVNRLWFERQVKKGVYVPVK